MEWEWGLTFGKFDRSPYANLWFVRNYLSSQFAKPSTDSQGLGLVCLFPKDYRKDFQFFQKHSGYKNYCYYRTLLPKHRHLECNPNFGNRKYNFRLLECLFRCFGQGSNYWDYCRSCLLLHNPEGTSQNPHKHHKHYFRRVYIQYNLGEYLDRNHNHHPGGYFLDIDGSLNSHLAKHNARNKGRECLRLPF